MTTLPERLQDVIAEMRRAVKGEAVTSIGDWADRLEAALLAKSAAYEALVAEIARAPVGKVEVYDTPEQWRYVIVPDHFDSGQRVRLLVSDDRPSHTAGENDA